VTLTRTSSPPALPELKHIVWRCSRRGEPGRSTVNGCRSQRRTRPLEITTMRPDRNPLPGCSRSRTSARSLENTTGGRRPELFVPAEPGGGPLYGQGERTRTTDRARPQPRNYRVAAQIAFPPTITIRIGSQLRLVPTPAVRQGKGRPSASTALPQRGRQTGVVPITLVTQGPGSSSKLGLPLRGSQVSGSTCLALLPCVIRSRFRPAAWDVERHPISLFSLSIEISRLYARPRTLGLKLVVRGRPIGPTAPQGACGVLSARSRPDIWDGSPTRGPPWSG